MASILYLELDMEYCGYASLGTHHVHHPGYTHRMPGVYGYTAACAARRLKSAMGSKWLSIQSQKDPY